MNRKVINRKIKIAFMRRSIEEGFALPITLGLGLIMLLIAATLIVRAQGDQTTALAQKATNQGLSAAETGISRYQSLINNNRLIAMYSRTGTPSWTNASSIPNLNNCTGGAASQVTLAATTNWQDIDSTNPSKGQYRLVEYTYSPTAGVVPGIGTLTVEGRVNQSGNDNTAGTAITKLEAKIPVNLGSLNTAVPALWVKNTKITKMGNDKVKGNILINSCPPATGATDDNLSDPDTQDVIANPVVFPDTPALPSARANGSASYYTLTNSPFDQTFPRPAVPAVPAIPATKTTPAIPIVPAVPADEPAADGYYHYLINNLVDNGNGTITISPGKKVVFHVQGNIDLGGNPKINPTSGNTPDQLQIYGNTYTNSSTTKYGCTGLSLGTTCPTLKVQVGGTGTIRAFVHAPDATGSVNGGGNTDGNFIGSMWLKDWDASSGNSKVKIDASGSYSDYLSSQNIVSPPSISPVSSWQRQETP